MSVSYSKPLKSPKRWSSYCSRPLHKMTQYGLVLFLSKEFPCLIISRMTGMGFAMIKAVELSTDQYQRLL